MGFCIKEILNLIYLNGHTPITGRRTLSCKRHKINKFNWFMDVWLHLSRVSLVHYSQLVSYAEIAWRWNRLTCGGLPSNRPDRPPSDFRVWKTMWIIRFSPGLSGAFMQASSDVQATKWLASSLATLYLHSAKMIYAMLSNVLQSTSSVHFYCKNQHAVRVSLAHY